jgi:hypothetical protein
MYDVLVWRRGSGRRPTPSPQITPKVPCLHIMVWFGEDLVGDAPLRGPIYPKGPLFTYHGLVWRRFSGRRPTLSPHLS